MGATLHPVPTVILTGATRGIGQAAAIELARRGAEVALVGRDAERVRETAERGARGGRRRAACTSTSPTSRGWTRCAGWPPSCSSATRASTCSPTTPARCSRSRHVTPDGFEQTFALNHLAPFLLTNLLRDRLVESRARVVTTSSDAHRGGVLDLDDLQSEHGRFRPGARLRHEQALQHPLHARAAAPPSPSSRANCFHPGVIRTGFGKNDGALVAHQPDPRRRRSCARRRAARGRWCGSRSTRRRRSSAARTSRRSKPVAPSAQAQDDALAAALWERSEALTAPAAARPPSG